MGRRRRSHGRDIQGILLFDKPAGMSSNNALQEVKHLFFARKAGHTGSLDPLATGLLPICFGNATRISGFLLDADKQYDLVCQLGITTTTGDAEGDIVAENDVPELITEQINTILQTRFIGRISQIPPMYSALKHKGQRLYELARKGIEVEREPREVTIHRLELLSIDNAQMKITIHCSKGTYVRTLVEDIGKALGTGAHVTELRRTAVSPFEKPQMYPLKDLEQIKEKDSGELDKLLLPAEAALIDYPDIHLNADSVFYLKQGQPVQVPHAPTSGWVRLYDGKAGFIGMGAIQDDGKVVPKRLFS